MYKRDYMMTMIEELAQFLGRLTFLKETRRVDVARIEIDDFCTRFLERSAADLRAMTPEEQIDFCIHDGELDVNPAIAIASMMKELGDLATIAGDAQEACDCYIRSLVLMLEAYGDGTRALPLEVSGRIEIVIGKLGDCEIPEILLRKLFRYLEVGGAYADAEDLLFELIDGGAPNAVQEGIAFYERLATHDDDDLAAGDLPRDEVEEGLAALRARV